MSLSKKSLLGLWNRALAFRLGLDLSKEELLTALAVYRKRKGLQPDLIKGCFIPWAAENKGAAVPLKPKADESKQVECPPPPHVQRTLCPTNTSCSDRIFLEPN